MMSIISKIFMFLSSYSPLYIFIITLNYRINDIIISISKIISFKINEIGKNDIILYILILLIFLSNIILFFLISASNKYTEPVNIVSIENCNDKVLDYILAYIVSFITTDFAQLTNSDYKILITSILIQLLLGYLYCKGNMFYINPMLSFFGYNIYLIKTCDGNAIILSKNEKKLENLTKELLEKDKLKKVYITKILNFFSEGIYILK